MVFNSLLVLSVANASTDVCQRIGCLPERVTTAQLIDLVCCFPLQRLGRLALCLWSFFCFPPPDSYYSYYYDSSDSSSSDDDSDAEDGDRHYYYESHDDS